MDWSIGNLLNYLYKVENDYLECKPLESLKKSSGWFM